MKTAIRFFIGFVMSVSLIVTVLLTSVELVTFNLNFYSGEYDKYHIPQSINVEKDDLLQVTEHLLGYMKGGRDDLVVVTKVNGQEREFFNQREKDHMVDVRELFSIGYKLRNVLVSLFFLGILASFLMKLGPVRLAAKAAAVGNTVFTIIFLILTFIISRDFERAFNLFHAIFFNNDLWILNPETDLLVCIVPQPFFIDISMTIGILFFAVLTFITVICAVYLRKIRPLNEDKRG